MNYSQFKKVKETDQHAVLKHPKGHEIRIAKKGLNSKLKKDLDALPMHYDEGGEVKEDDAPVSVAVNTQNPYIPEQYMNPSSADPAAERLPEMAPLDPVAPKPEEVGLPKAESGKASQESSAPPSAPTLQNYNLRKGAPTPNPSSPAQGMSNVPFAENLNDYVAAHEGQLAGIQKEAEAQGQLGQEQGKIAGQHANDLTHLNQQYQTKIAEADQHIQQAVQDYKKGFIQPNHYLENMSTAGKISTAIGLVLGGMGGGITRQGNPVLNFLNSQIDRDIQSQMNNLGKQHNLLSAYMQQYRDQGVATDMTKATLLSINAAKFQEAGAKAQDPIQKARAEQMANQIKMQTIPLLHQIANKNLVLSQGAGGGGGGQGVSPALQARYLAPDPGTYQQARGEIREQENINSANQAGIKAFDEVAKINTISGRVKNFTQAQKLIDAYWGPMIDKVTKNNTGRVTPITVDLISGLKPEVTDSDSTVAKKRTQFLALLNQERSTPTLDAIGVKVGKDYGVAQPNQNVMLGYNQKQAPKPNGSELAKR